MNHLELCYFLVLERPLCRHLICIYVMEFYLLLKKVNDFISQNLDSKKMIFKQKIIGDKITSFKMFVKCAGKKVRTTHDFF